MADLRLHRGPGVVAVLGAPEDGTLALVDVLSGRCRPERGKVLLSGREPHRDASLRRRIGVLGHTPELAPGRSVAASVTTALMARGDSGRAAEVLEKAGLAALAKRDVVSLSFAEARAVDAALALSLESPMLLVLCDPFAEVASIPASFVIERIRVAAERCPVVVVTSSPADARRATSGAATDVVLVLHRGAFARAADAEGRLAYPRRAEICAWVSDRLRELVRRLGDDPAVLGVSWEPTAETERGEAGIVRMAGSDPSALALALADAATECGCHIAGISEVAPTLAEVRTATEWIRYATHARESAARRAPGPGAVQIAPRAARRDEDYAPPPDAISARLAAAVHEGPSAVVPSEVVPSEVVPSEVLSSEVPSGDATAEAEPASEANMAPNEPAAVKPKGQVGVDPGSDGGAT